TFKMSEQNEAATYSEDVIAESSHNSEQKSTMGRPTTTSPTSESRGKSPVNGHSRFGAPADDHFRMFLESFANNAKGPRISLPKKTHERKGIAGRYPEFFGGEVCRAQLKTFLADYPPDPWNHGWVEIKGDGAVMFESKRQMLVCRQLAKLVVLSHLLVFNSNRLLTQALRDILPLSAESALFNQVRNEAYTLFSKYEDEFLWEGFYQLVNNMLDLHGHAVTGDFRLDADVWERNAENLIHTEQFLLDTFTKELWLEYFDMFEDLADWDAVFEDRTAMPFFFISTLYTTICFEMADVVLSERRMNPAEPEEVVTQTEAKGNEDSQPPVVSAAAIRDTVRWNTDSEGRAHMHCFLEMMGAHPDFCDVELDLFPWIEWKEPSTDALLMEISRETMRHRYVKKNVPRASKRGMQIRSSEDMQVD
ncbi:uncharacterized protein PpBr36_11505, partial [Pyricularia pennisetigena]|uniref:uncharacterized protein n=1 Tax=Pyricularia pennisetigena TaxID=1578925 RepID=UPI00114F590B